MIQNLAYEFSLLAKAVQHKNLSAAAVHVGLSQPQLSRLIAKIELELNVILLDRSARRKSGWTPVALDLAQAFSKGLGRLESEILMIAQEREPTELHIGTLEGLANIALQFAQDAFTHLKMTRVYLDILDFQDLEAQFLGGNLDLIFTVKAPSKQKFAHIIEVGNQQLEEITSDPDIWVGSPYDLMGEKKNDLKFNHFFVSNSLSLRERWLREFGGTGHLPVETHKGKGKGNMAIYLYGSDLITPKLWKRVQALAE